jgi:hypothetical protein
MVEYLTNDSNITGTVTNGNWYSYTDQISIGASSACWVPIWPNAEEKPAKKKKDKNMRHLYEVYIVDPETDVVQKLEGIVAATEKSAERKAIQGSNFDKDLDDYDFIVVKLGDVRAKKSVQEVKVVE